MKGVRIYEVSFSGLKDGKHQFEFPITKEFFDLFDAEVDFLDYQGKAEILLDKHSTFMEAEITSKGTATLRCDYDGEPFKKEVENSFPLVIKFGEAFNDEDDEVLIIPHEAYQFNAAQYIYENILLSIPLKRACQVCQTDAEEQDYIIEDPEVEPTSDPRWDALKKIKKK